MRVHRAYSWREFVLDLDRGCLLRSGNDVRLRPKSFHVLTHLVERHGRLVTKEDLIQAVWPDTFVSDDSLTKCLVDIRKALGDESQQVVKTVPRRGYIFDAPIESRGGEAAATDGLAAYTARRHNLPAPITSFVGRAAELSDLVAQLRSERLITLAGPGGCGKTRLALEAAAALTEDFADGVWLTELAALTEPRLVVEAVAASMGLRPDADSTLTQRLTHYLSARSTLIVLDNCEHLLGACADLADALVRFCPGVRLLVTSREPLRVPGERVRQLPSLSLPAHDADFDAIAAAASVRLMADRTAAVVPSFELTRANALDVSTICRRLDGLPLAIELAAARTRVLSLAQIASRLDDRFRLLVGGSRTALPRHQMLSATIDWSYELLSEPERELFRRLAVFAGGWTLDAAAAVSVDPSGELDVLEVLSALLDKSLVTVDADTTTGRRFHMLETVREYSRDRLIASGEQSIVQTRHVAYFRGLAAVARRELIGPTQATWLKRLEREHDNFRAALTWCEEVPERTETGLELCAGLHWFWFKHGHFNEPRRWLHGLLARQPSAAPDATGLAAECWFSLGLSTVLTGHPDEGGRYLARSLQLAREAGSDWLVIAVLRMIVHGLLEIGQLEAAEAGANEAIAVAHRMQGPGDLAAAIGTLGMVHRVRGDYDRAAECFHQEMALWRAFGDEWMLAASASDTAEAELQRGNVQVARTLTMDILAHVDSSDAPTLAWNLEMLGRALAADRAPLAAAQVWGAAELVYERTGLKTPQYMRLPYEDALRAARAAVDDESAFTAAWNEGRRKGPARAVAAAQRGA